MEYPPRHRQLALLALLGLGLLLPRNSARAEAWIPFPDFSPDAMAVSQGAWQAWSEIPRIKLVEQKPPRFEILINIPATQLTLYDQGVPVKQYQVSVGTHRWPTPEGKFEIYEFQWNPWWLPPESEWAKDAEKTPPGPANPLYPVKLMMPKALRIHGTNSNWSIGRAASHGCMRMRRGEVRELAEFLESEILPDRGPEQFETYRKKTWQPFRTVLPQDQKIWVYLIYEPLERRSNQLILHPNYYGRRIAYEEHLMDHLLEAGVYTAPIDLGKFHAIRKKLRKTTPIPFQDILYDHAKFEKMDTPFMSACLVENEETLPRVRSRFNTYFEPHLLPRELPGEIQRVSQWGRNP